ncbi:STAS domain-containing protein [Streptomyces sp. NBC_01352]|uniref:STAS domain-containing protein n=1 Tax=Streptomyces plumbiresistens TaxID=511811 RepID=A0ABP7QW03_9ACTN|nr:MULTISPECIES: STAS domain-containing protein [unclassified Streptomyces]MCX4699573.1 STAS domain-containing protein [Streptomyces sp. NBC_01373]
MTFIPNPCELRDLRDLPGCTVIALPPEIDLCNAEGLYHRIMSAADARADRLRLLVLDLTGTHFMDSQGVRLVDQVRRVLQPRTRVRVVAAPHGVACRVLELTGVRRDVPVYDNLAEALER